MKILMVIDTLMCGGAQKMFTFVANGLFKKGADIVVISYASKEHTFKFAEGIKFVTGQPYINHRLFRHVLKIPSICKVIREEQPEALIAFGPIPAILSVFAVMGRNIPVVFCERGDPYQYNDILSKIKLYPVRFADWYVFQSEAAKAFYSKKIQKRSTVIPNPVTIEYVPRIDNFMLSNDIVSIGRLDLKQKRQDLLVKAFSKVVKQYPDLKLIFYGDGEDRENILELVHDLGIINSVTFAGEIKDVHSRLRNSKMFVLTSDFEGMPNALIEAMAAGLPCISTNYSPGGVDLLIDNYISGIIVNKGDVDSISNAIIYLVEHPEFAHQFGVKAQGIISRYNSDKILEQWKNMVNKLI